MTNDELKPGVESIRRMHQEGLLIRMEITVPPAVFYELDDRMIERGLTSSEVVSALVLEQDTPQPSKGRECVRMCETDELRERAELLRVIANLEQQANWTPIEDLQERVSLLNEIAVGEQQAD